MGGVEQYVLNVLDYIDQNQFEIEVLLPENRVYDREDALTERGITIHKFSSRDKKTQIKEFQGLVSRKKYDVVHIQLGHAAALWSMVSYYLKIPKIIVHAHTSETGDENVGKFHLFKKKIIFKLSELIFRRTAECVACSDDAAKFMFGKNKNYRILNNGICLEKYMQSEIEKSNKKENQIGIIARFDPQKNPLFVVEVMNELKKINSEIELNWIGNGPMQRQTEEKIRRLHLEDTIHLRGNTNEIPEFLSENRYFFLPSLYEGLGIVLIEAQAVGLKCFISEHLPLSVDCGGCVRIPLSKDAKEWARIIQEEIASSAEPVIDQKKLKAFDIKTTVKELENLYKS